MTEVLRYSLIGKEDIKLDPRDGRFQVTLADGRVVMLSALDVALLLSDAYAKASLPGGAAVGQIARVTDVTRGLWTVAQGGRWFALNGDKADVREFGAVGDGSTDDTAAIQAACTAMAAAGGGVVWVPPGTYRISASPGLTIGTKVTLQGSGFASVLSYVGGSQCIFAQSVTDVAVRDLMIQGVSGSSGAMASGVEFQSVTRGTIQGVYVTTFQLHGLVINASAQTLIQGCLVENTDVDQTQTGIGIMASFEGTNRSLIVGNHIRNVYHSGMYIDAGTSGGVGTPSENIVVAGNVIENTGFIAGIFGAGSKRVCVANNVIMNAGARGNQSASGIYFSQDNAVAEEQMLQVVIVGNYIGYPTEHGIRLSGVMDFIVADNMIVNTGALSPVPPGNVRGIYLLASTGTGTPVTQRGVITGNHIRYTGSGGKLTFGIEIAASCNDLLISDNSVSGQSASAINDVSGAANVAIGPTFDITNSRMLPNAFRGRHMASAASLTGTTSLTTLATFSLPARTLGLWGRLRLRYVGRIVAGGSPAAAVLRLVFGGATPQTLLTQTPVATQYYSGEAIIENTGSASAQLAFWHTLLDTAVDIHTNTTFAENTDADLDILLTGQLTNTGDTISVLQCDVEVLR